MIIKTIVAAAILVVVYLVFELGIFYYKYTHLPVLPAIDQSDKTFGSGPTLKYIAAGDSTAVGYGASKAEYSYTYKIAQFLAKDHNVQYKNVAIIGAKTKGILENQLAQIIAYKPDIVTISMGANDATHQISRATTLNNYKTIIQKLEEGTKAKIYITDINNFYDASILPWFYIRLIEFQSKSQNRGILTLEDERVKIVDIHDFGWDLPPYKNKSKTLAADHFHPNDLGYQNWTNAFLDKIGK